MFNFVLTLGTFLNSHLLPSSEVCWKPFWRNVIAKSANQEGTSVSASPYDKNLLLFCLPISVPQGDWCLKSITPWTAQSARLPNTQFFSWTKITLGQKGPGTVNDKKHRNVQDYKDQAVYRCHTLLPSQSSGELYLTRRTGPKARLQPFKQSYAGNNLLNSPNIFPSLKERKKTQSEVPFFKPQLLTCEPVLQASSRTPLRSAQLSALPERTRPASSASCEGSSACSHRARRLPHSHSTTAGASGLLRTNKSTFSSILSMLCDAWFFFAPPSPWT